MMVIAGTKDMARYAVPVNVKARTCPVCGKRFKASTGWVYHSRSKVFCRWNCQMQYEKEHPKKTKLKGAAAYGWYVTGTDVWKDSYNDCVARVRLCQKNLDKFRSKLCNDPHGQSAGAVRRWEAKLEEAQLELAKWEAPNEEG